MTTPFRVRRALLFVPAVRTDRYHKALATGADSICIDLEDGVALGEKAEARDAALTFFARREPTHTEVVLRINDPKTDLGQADVTALRNAAIRPDALMLPKANGADEIVEVESLLADVLPDLPLIVMVETAQGLAAAREIATATPNVAAVFFGAIDFSSDVGCAVEWDALLYARSRVVLAAALARTSAIDSPFMDVSAVETLSEECQRVRRLGFIGKAAIHPTQVAVIQDTFSPSADEIRWAHKVLEAYKQNRGGVLLVDGKLVERPVIIAAERTLAIASKIGC